MSSYSFTVPGCPVAKGRHRAVRTAAGVRTFTPPKTEAFESRVALSAGPSCTTPLEGPLSVEITAIFPMKGSPRQRVPRPRAWKATRPDGDNIAKAVLDALNGIAFHDDGQVVELVVRKIHAAQGEVSRTDVTVTEIANQLPRLKLANVEPASEPNTDGPTLFPLTDGGTDAD